MNNLKRILSLALASVMVMGMMVVGASATRFVDDDKIDNKDAVETLDALGIMQGDERGFRPEDGLTRAEAAKMLAKLHNKGVDVNYGTKSTPTFGDTKGHWAEGNIEYAAAFGIANGKGNGIFDPQGSLRVVELARMLLNMMGYNEGKTGSDWEIQTTVLASNLGLFEDLETVDPTANVTRDQAAQILYNALYIDMDETYIGNVETETTSYKIVLKTATETAEAKTAEIDKMTFSSAAEALVIAQSFDLTAGTHYTIQNITDTITVKGPVNQTLAHKYLSLNQPTAVLESVKLVASGTNKGKYEVKLANGTTVYTATDICSDMIGEKVQVLYKSATNVYGIVSAGSVLFEGTVGDLAGYVLTMSATNAAVLTGTNAIEWNNPSVNNIDWTEANEYWNVKVIQTGTAPTYRVTVTPVSVASVSNVTATTIVVNNGIGSKTIDKEIKGYTGITKGDKIVVTAAANTVSGMIELAKAETMEGVAADAVRPTYGEVRINGTWYPALDNAYTELAKMTANAAYDLVLVNGYIVSHATAVTAASTDLVILTQVAENVTGLNDYKEARAYFVADGTTQIIKLSQATADAVVETTNTLLTYTVNTNGYYVTKTLASNLGYDDKAANATVTSASTTTTAKISGNLIADDAKIIVLYNKGGKGIAIETVDAKTARTWDVSDAAFSGFGSTGVSFANNVNGVPYVKFAFINASTVEALPGQQGATGNYGYVVSDPYLTTSNGVKYSTYDIWTGSAVVKGVLDKVTTELLKKGDFIAYTDLGNNMIDTTVKSGVTDVVTRAGRILGTPAAVTGLSTADEVIYLLGATGPVNGGSSLKLDDKTKIFFVDSKKTEGVATGTLELASITNGAYTPNVKYVPGASSHVDILIVDVSNAMYGEGSIATLASIKALDDGVYTSSVKYLPGITNFDDNGQNVFFKFTADDTAKTYTLQIKKGSTLVYEETSDSYDDEAGHFFVINMKRTGPGSGSRKDEATNYKSWTDAQGNTHFALKQGTYTVTVNDGTTNVLNGTFTVPNYGTSVGN